MLTATALVIVAHITGALTSVHAVMNARTSQGAIAWAIGLNTMPFVVVPAYWVLGQSEYDGYVTAHRAAKELTSELPPAVLAHLEEQDLRVNRDGKTQVIERLAALPYTHGNELELLIDGAETFDAISASIENAQHFVLFQFYIIRDDELGQRFKHLLIEKAKQGVQVYFLYDGVGSHALSESYKDDLRDAGVKLASFSSMDKGWEMFQVNFRNHRKVVIVDGQHAFLGGLNIGNEYLGGSSETGDWRDTHVRVSGPAALAAQLSFVEDWQWAAGELLQLDWSPHEQKAANIPAIVIATGPADQVDSAELLFLNAINSAETRLWIATPYFTPDLALVTALQLAAMRGVDVRILLPEKADSTVVWLAGFTYFEEIMPLGVKIYAYGAGIMHSKVMLIDDATAIIGSANLDNRSMRLNFEISAVASDSAFAAQVEEMLLADFERSKLYEKDAYSGRPFWFRFAARVSRLASPVL